MFDIFNDIDGDNDHADFLADMDEIMAECDAIVLEFEREVAAHLASFDFIPRIVRHPDFQPVQVQSW